MEVIIKEKKFILKENIKEGFDLEETTSKLTDYFDNYDYIVGDWAYGKLRLKGFNDKGSKYFNKFNDSKNIDKYIKENCAYGCKHFILQRINIDKE